MLLMSIAVLFSIAWADEAENSDQAVGSTELNVSEGDPESGSDSAEGESASSAVAPLQSLLNINQVYDSVGDPFRNRFQWPNVMSSDWKVELSDTGLFDLGGFVLESHFRFVESSREYEADIQEFNRIRITNENGIAHGAFAITLFVRDRDPDPQFRARVIFPNGDVKHFNSNAVQRQLIREQYTGNLIKYSYTIPDVTENCIVDHYYRYRANGNPDRTWRFQSTLPVLKAYCYWYPSYQIVPLNMQPLLQYFEFLQELYGYTLRISVDTVHVSDDRDVTFAWRGPDRNGTSLFVPESRPVVVRMAVENVPSFTPEPYSYPDNLQQSRVRFFRSPAAGDTAFWDKTKVAAVESMKEFCKKSKRARKLAEKVKKDIGSNYWIDSSLAHLRKELLNKECQKWYTERERMERLFKSRGELKVEFQRNENVDDALKHGYAEVAEYAMVFQQMMKELGYDAHIAYMCDRQYTILDKDIPERQFDYVLVRIAKDSSVVWCDPAAPFMRAGELRWNHQGVSTLLVNEDSAYFGEIPMLQEPGNVMQRTIEVSHFDTQGWSGVEKRTYVGAMTSVLRNALWHINPTGHNAEVLKVYSDIDTSPDSLMLSGVMDITAPITVEFKRKVAFSGFVTGERLLVPLEDFFGEFENPFVNDVRTQPIIFSYPFKTLTVVRLKMPENWTATATGDWDDIQMSFGRGESRLSAFGQELSAQAQFQIASPLIDKSAYPDVRKLFEWRQAMSQSTIAFQMGSK